jgi:hypothetical protein
MPQKASPRAESLPPLLGWPPLPVTTKKLVTLLIHTHNLIYEGMDENKAQLFDEQTRMKFMFELLL